MNDLAPGQRALQFGHFEMVRLGEILDFPPRKG
jgi:hypothetical protein